MQATYTTVYQITSDPSLPFFANALKVAVSVTGIVFIAMSIACYLLWERRNQQRLPGLRMLAPILVGGSSLFFFVASLALWELNSLISRGQEADAAAFKAFQQGEYRMVEGPVTNFSQMPFEGHKPECFSVQQTRFCYSDYFVAPGFRKTSSHEGPIRLGLIVRVAFMPTKSNNTILRLEVAD